MYEHRIRFVKTIHVSVEIMSIQRTGAGCLSGCSSASLRDPYQVFVCFCAAQSRKMMNSEQCSKHKP